MGQQPQHRRAVAGPALMELRWTTKVLSYLARLYEFLAPVNQATYARVVQSLTNALMILLVNPRIGEQLFEFELREIR